MLFEIILPAGISLSVGVSTLILATLYHFGYVVHPASMFLYWAVISVVAVAIGATVSRLLFGGKQNKIRFDEDQDAVGKVVQVRQTVTVDGGRISFLGTTWDARTTGSQIIEAGQSARICGRDNITWLVEPHSGE
jgi:membrane protein implicated in regulation of membrane protease activity